MFLCRVRTCTCRRSHSSRSLKYIQALCQHRFWDPQHKRQWKLTLVILTYVRLIVDDRDRPDRTRIALRTNPHGLGHLLSLLDVIRISLLASVQPVLRDVIPVAIGVIRLTPLREKLFSLVTQEDLLGSVYVRPFSRPLHVRAVPLLFFRIVLVPSGGSSLRPGTDESASVLAGGQHDL